MFNDLQKDSYNAAYFPTQHKIIPIPYKPPLLWHQKQYHSYLVTRWMCPLPFVVWSFAIFHILAIWSGVDCAVWPSYNRESEGTNRSQICWRSWSYRFISPDDGPVPVMKIRPLGLPHYSGYKRWLIKPNSLEILQKTEIIVPGHTSGTVWISELGKEAPSACQPH